MARWWISLPSRWELQDVQAALNVIITVLSTAGTFVFVRYCWHRAAKRVARDDDVPLPTLLSLNTLGEAFDVLFFLKAKLLSPRYVTILAQCLVVICLSIMTLLAGVITRYSTRMGEIISQRDVSGSLASRYHNGMGYANVEWNQTYSRLDAADFPLDQLVDFLPNNQVDWVYESSEWNNSWSFACQYTPHTPITLYDSGNCTGLRYEIPNLGFIFPYEEWDGYWHNHAGYYDGPDNIKDELLFIYGWRNWDYEEACYTYRAMTLQLLSVHMHNIPRNRNGSDQCDFLAGDIGESAYTGITCELRRAESVEDACNVAFPDVSTNEMVTFAYTEYYQARFAQESTSDSPISEITPRELARFYQTYTVVKDLQFRQPVTRQLSVNVEVVQLSTVFLVIALLIALLIIIGLFQYTWFMVRHHDISSNTPQSKLDWMVQSIQTEDRPLADDKGRLRRSVTVDPDGLAAMPSVRRKRREFEHAKFGGRATTTWFLRDSPSMTDHGKSPSLSSPGISSPGIPEYRPVPRREDSDVISGHQVHASPQLVQSEKGPMLSVNPGAASYWSSYQGSYQGNYQGRGG